MFFALSPLRSAPFRALFGARLVNEVGYWFGAVALAVLVYDRTDSALATTALFLGIEFLPALLAPALVARVDLLPTRLILPAIYAAEAATFVVLFAVARHFSLPAVVLLATVDGTLSLGARSLTRATAASVLEPIGQLRAGNALLNVSFTTAAAIGPGLAGLVVAALHPPVALLLAAASLISVAATLAAAQSLPRAPTEAGGDEDGDGGWATRFRAGLRLVRGDRVLRTLFGAQAAAFVFFSAVVPIEVVYAKAALRVGDVGYGALLTSWGAGMVVGSLVFVGGGRLPLRPMLAVSTLAVSGAYLVMGVAGTLVLACAAAVVGGLGNGVQWVAVMSAVQEATPSRFQARVVGLLESVAAGMTGVGFVVGGAVAAALSPRTSFLVAGVGIAAVVATASMVLGRAEWPGPTSIEAGEGTPRSPSERGRPADSALSP